MPNRKSNYKDMDKYLKTRNRQRHKYYSKTAKYEGRPWTAAEDKMVLEHAIIDTELSAIIKRSVGAIQSRRCMLKNKLKEEIE